MNQGESVSSRLGRFNNFGRDARWYVVPFVIGISCLALLFSYSAYSGVDDDPLSTFRLLTGSENRILFDDPDSEEPTMIERFEEEHDVNIIPFYQGSVDTMLDIQAGATQYDAVWPASSIWINLGDQNRVVSRIESIMATPVVLALHRSKAEELGWVGADVTVQDILDAAESGQFDFMMSSATQSNSGAMAYLGYLYAFADHPDVLTSEMLAEPELQDQVTRLLGTVDKTAGASGYLRDYFLDNYQSYDGMVNNESAIITANQRLIEAGETNLLHVVYPVDGLAIADWPLGFVDHDIEGNSETFDQLQAYLLEEEIQDELLGMGRRTGSVGINLDPAQVDQSVFNPDWGIDVSRAIDPINLPDGDVVLEALNLYQSNFRKPSWNVFCLDFSGSMNGSGEKELTEAMAIILDQQQASQYFLQRTENDTTVVIPFNDGVIGTWKAEGSNGVELANLQSRIENLRAGLGTEMYKCLTAAMRELAAASDDSRTTFFENYSPAIILLTDGKSEDSAFEIFKEFIDPDFPVPVYSIKFGDASEEQLLVISDLTGGDVYDGSDGLIDALRLAFGNA